MGVTLICEGLCNPGLEALDRQVARVGRDLSAFDVAAFVRRATYTEHLPTNGAHDVYRCTVCGTPRQYGGDPFRMRYAINRPCASA